MNSTLGLSSMTVQFIRFRFLFYNISEGSGPCVISLMSTSFLFLEYPLEIRVMVLLSDKGDSYRNGESRDIDSVWTRTQTHIV